jgi:hypothetical protein
MKKFMVVFKKNYIACKEIEAESIEDVQMMEDELYCDLMSDESKKGYVIECNKYKIDKDKFNISNPGWEIDIIHELK